MIEKSAAVLPRPDQRRMTVAEPTDASARPPAADTGTGAPRRSEREGEVERLLAAVRDQDAEAFRALYDLTAGHLMGVVMRTCRDRAMAEDVLQEVYVQVWRRGHLYDPTLGPGLAWLTVLARRRAIDAVRSSGRRARHVSDLGLEMLDALPLRAHDIDQPTELRQLLHCLGKLDTRNRRAVLLAYYEGWTREELALHFERPEGTIKTWLRRSLIALRACMETR